MLRHPFIALLALLALAQGSVAFARTAPIVLDRAGHEIAIGDRVEIAVDSIAHEDPSSVPPVPSRLRFERSRQTIPNFDVDERAIYWIRFDVVDRVEGGDRYLAIGNPTARRIDVYVLRGDSLVEHAVYGTTVPVDRKDLRTRVPVARLSLADSTRHTVVLRIDGGIIGHYFPLTILDGAALAETISQRTMVYGVYAGFMLFMVLLNLAFTVALRESTYLYFAASIVALVAINLAIEGVLFQWFFTSMPAPVAETYVVTGAIMQATSILFGRAYLRTRYAAPRLDRVLRAVLVLVVAMPIVWLIDPRAAVSVTTATAGSYYLLLLAVAVIQWRRGYRPAVFFVVSWIVYIACAALITLYYRGDYPYVFIYFGMIGTALHALILSFGLADATSVDRREKRQIQQRALEHQTALARSFARFVPREILGFLGREEIQDVALGDVVERNLTILFSDMRSFTSLSERLTPRETFVYLNDYLGLVGPLIREHGGFIDKYVGDAIMAVFPTSTSAAVETALAMLERLRHFNETNGARHPPLAIGIGIHTGPAMLGTIGESQRMDGTVIADAVNLASRLQSLTKEYATDLLVSRDVVDALDGTRFECRLVDAVVVRGREERTEVYEVHAVGKGVAA